jgi:hypothetical protein
MTSPDETMAGPTAPQVLLRPLPESLGLVLDLIGVTFIALFLIGFVGRNVTHQGDLKTYLTAGRAALHGLDPYVPENLSELAGRRVFPFVYPPIGLVPFIAAASLPGMVASAAWMWGKIALLGALVFAWARWFGRGARLLPIALVAVFGWNSSAQWDLSNGNVAILECGLVWAALGCFLAGWRTRFALLIVAAACFKLMPAAFLLLLLVPTDRAAASPKRFAAALALLALVTMGPTVIGPAAHFQRFWDHVPDATSYGNANPSALGLAALLAQSMGFKGQPAGTLALTLWSVYALALLVGSMPLIRHTYRLHDARRWAMSAVFLYVLLLPRPMAYGFAMLTPAPLFFLPKPFRRPPGQLVLALMLAAQGLWRLTSIATDSPLATYAPFLLSLCVWLLILNEHSTALATMDTRRVSPTDASSAPAAVPA